jgi:hypothetical protein
MFNVGLKFIGIPLTNSKPFLNLLFLSSFLQVVPVATLLKNDMTNVLQRRRSHADRSRGLVTAGRIPNPAVAH